MGSLLSYSGVSTKVRAMEKKLLKWSDYESLSETSNLTDAVVYLKTLPAYESVLSDIEETRINREQLEKSILRSLYIDFQKIYQFCNPKQRRFLAIYFKRFEIEVIKYFFRDLYNSHRETFYIHTRKEFFKKYSKLDLEQLFSCETIEQLIESLKETEYYNVLHKLLQSPSTELKDYELALDLYYFSLLWKQKGKLFKGKELKAITRDYGVQIDLLNLQWMYRAKKYYRLSATEIYALAIPIHYKVKRVQFMELAETESLEEFLSLLENTYYGKKYASLVTGDIESTYFLLLNKIYRLDIRQNPYSMVAIHTYLYQKEREIDSLTTVLECVRYGFGSAETLKLIRGENT